MIDNSIKGRTQQQVRLVNRLPQSLRSGLSLMLLIAACLRHRGRLPSLGLPWKSKIRCEEMDCWEPQRRVSFRSIRLLLRSSRL